jgi:hypothetical protein
MKKLIITSLIALNILGLNSLSFSQDGSAFDKGSLVVTAGYGFPDLYRTSLRLAYNSYSSSTVKGFGPLLFKGDYGIVKFKWGHSVGVGAVIGYNSTSVNFTNYYWNNSGFYNTSYTQTDKYRTITIGARGTYHFFTKEKFDCYASVGLGFNINSYSYSSSVPNIHTNSSHGRSVLYSALTVGIRYYFTKNIGVYSELGWDLNAPIQGGLCLKF